MWYFFHPLLSGWITKAVSLFSFLETLMSAHWVSQKVAAPFFVILLLSPVNTVIYFPIFYVEYVTLLSFSNSHCTFSSPHKMLLIFLLDCITPWEKTFSSTSDSVLVQAWSSVLRHASPHSTLLQCYPDQNISSASASSWYLPTCTFCCTFRNC